jgi:hypothetical protein
MSSPQNTIERIFMQAESEISTKLLREGFCLQKQVISEEAFGSRYTVWMHQKDRQALRLVWDGKEGWFVVEESPFSDNSEPNSWAEIVLVPFDKTNTENTYNESIIRELVHEVR